MHTFLVILLVISFLGLTYYQFCGDRIMERKIKKMYENRAEHWDDIMDLHNKAMNGEISIDDWEEKLSDIYEGKFEK